MNTADQHHESIDSKAHAPGWRHPLFEGFEEALIVWLGLFVAAPQGNRLTLEAAALLVGVIQLAEGVGDLDPTGERLPALNQTLLASVGLGKRGRARPDNRR